MKARTGRVSARIAAEVREEGVLNLQPGELVEVKPEAEIRCLLDSTGRTRGMRFMTGMYGSCGGRFRVFKRAETIILEGSGEVRRLKDTVLLEGSICGGENVLCDRSCFYFWKEAWLRRVNPGETGAAASPFVILDDRARKA